MSDAKTLDDATCLLSRESPRLLFAELLLPKQNGLEIIGTLRQRYPATEIIVLSPIGAPRYVVDAVRAGATGFLTKDDDDETILSVAHEALEQHSLENRATVQFPSAATVPNIDVRAIAARGGHLLIAGELGTGRKRLARALHNSTSQPGVLRFVDCSQTATEPLCSVFNVVGPATSGQGTRQPIDNTICLLRAEQLSHKELTYLEQLCSGPMLVRLGESCSASVRYRIIAVGSTADASPLSCVFAQMTKPPLEVEVIEIPPLRQRIQCLPQLCEKACRQYGDKLGVSPKVLAPDALEILTTYPWPGNLVELNNLMERLTLTCSEPVVDASMIPLEFHIGTWKRGLSYRAAMERMERGFLMRILERSGGCRRRAAERLGLSYSTLKFRLKKLGVSGEQVKRANLPSATTNFRQILNGISTSAVVPVPGDQ